MSSSSVSSPSVTFPYKMLYSHLAQDPNTSGMSRQQNSAVAYALANKPIPLRNSTPAIKEKIELLPLPLPGGVEVTSVKVAQACENLISSKNK